MMEELHDIVFNPQPLLKELSKNSLESDISTTASSVHEDREESFKKNEEKNTQYKDSNKENKPPIENEKDNKNSSDFDFNQVQSGYSKLEALRI